MNDTDKGMPADWAIDRVRVLAGHTAHALQQIKAHPTIYGWLLSFARYVEVHEEPPADPLLIEAREIVAAFWETQRCPREAQAARDGDRDATSMVGRTIEGIRRGIELAKEQSA